MGIPCLIGYLWLHLTQTRLFLSFVYLKLALQIGQARILNKSLGIGSFFSILVNIKGKIYILVMYPLYKYYCFMIAILQK